MYAIDLIENVIWHDDIIRKCMEILPCFFLFDSAHFKGYRFQHNSKSIFRVDSKDRKHNYINVMLQLTIAIVLKIKRFQYLHKNSLLMDMDQNLFTSESFIVSKLN